MSALDRTGTSRGYCRVPHCLARPVPHSLAAAVAAMSGGDAGSPPLPQVSGPSALHGARPLQFGRRRRSHRIVDHCQLGRIGRHQAGARPGVEPPRESPGPFPAGLQGVVGERGPVDPTCWRWWMTYGPACTAVSGGRWKVSVTRWRIASRGGAPICADARCAYRGRAPPGRGCRDGN